MSGKLGMRDRNCSCSSDVFRSWATTKSGWPRGAPNNNRPCGVPRARSTSANFDFGQFDFCQFLDVEFWDDKVWGPQGWGPKGWRPKPRKSGAPKGGAQKGAQKGGRPKFSLFFPLLRHNFLYSSLSWGPFVEFCWCLKCRGPEMCTFGVLGLSCASPGGPFFFDDGGMKKVSSHPTRTN